MKMLLRLSLLLVCAAGSWAAATVPAPRYVINLDLAAQDRWTHVIPDYKADFQSLLKQIKKMLPPEVVDLASLIGDDVEKYVPYPYSLEMVGVAVAGDVALGEVLLGNMLYEVTAFNSSKLDKACTSIVAEAVNGTIYHGRNLDYTFTEVLRNMTIIAEFQSGGKTVYTGGQLGGLVAGGNSGIHAYEMVLIWQRGMRVAQYKPLRQNNYVDVATVKVKLLLI